ncbi:hypothetical protein B0A49_02771 [Cryomyces minteri]|uniref:Uncharacterized protein n=1 Tax=Cryomyces minteri TaxID=331657 RepID=A0A4U0XK12_9PEZI|nr:hypothetical protein B0A49_02771 [Cryomyces minteri]
MQAAARSMFRAHQSTTPPRQRLGLSTSTVRRAPTAPKLPYSSASSSRKPQPPRPTPPTPSTPSTPSTTPSTASTTTPPSATPPPLSPPPTPKSNPPNPLLSPKTLNRFVVEQLTARRPPPGANQPHPSAAEDASKRAVKTGALPAKYRTAARRITLAMVALPIAIVTSWVLWNRVLKGEERKRLVRTTPPPPVPSEPPLASGRGT